MYANTVALRLAQTMRHDPKWATFNSAYCIDPTKNVFIAMLSHIDVMRGPRATSNVIPKEILDQLEPDPEVLELGRSARGSREAKITITTAKIRRELSRLAKKKKFER